MSLTTHADHHFSVTVKTDDVAVLHCLRALADYAQETGNKRIAWGGTTKDEWERSRHAVSFHFSHPTYRASFLREASRLFPAGLWQNVGEHDGDPAKPRR